MRKNGKYEKMPDGTSAKQPAVKSMLLQTYFTSLICLVLCVTMFFGTSYAWFTSEVQNTGNEIYIGTLDVDLKDENGNSLANSSEKLFDGNIRWEPGYTTLETIQVINEGDLAFKYVLSFTEGKAQNAQNEDVTTTIANIAKYFDVWVFDHQDNDYTKPGSYEALTTATGWEPAGSLDELLDGKSVLEGVMTTVRKDDFDAKNPVPTEAGDPNNTDVVKTVDTYTIALHMKEEVDDADLMGHKISLNVKLVAYQMGSENDSFGNQYDEADYVTNVKELQEAINNAADGDVIRFANDIDGDVTVTQKPDIKFTIDGAEHTLDGSITVNGKSARYETAGLTIQNIVFTGVSGTDSGYIYLGTKNNTNNTRYTNHVTVKNCTFNGIDDGEDRKTAAVRSFTGGDRNLVVDGCTIDNKMHSMLQLDNVEEGLKVIDCKVSSKNGINLNHTNSLEMSGCTFDVEGYAVRFGVDDDKNHTINTEMKNFTIANSALKAACNDGDAVIIFRDSSKYATLTLTNTTVEGTVKVKGNITDTTTIIGLN